MCKQCQQTFQEMKRLEARVNLLHEAVADVLYELRKPVIPAEAGIQRKDNGLDSASSAE